MNNLTEIVRSIPDTFLVAEVAKRLTRKYRRETGKIFKYGHFKLMFHDGRLAKIEEWARCNRFKEESVNNLVECV